MAQRQHLFIRNGLWYWRRTYRAGSLLRRSEFLSSEGEIALALGTRDKSRAQAIGRQLSTLFEAWMDRFQMLGMLETLDLADFRALIGWALQDARDVYMTRIALPDAIPDAVRSRQVNKLRAEAAVIEEAIKSGDFSMVQGLAADLLRRRSIRFEFDAPVFQSFVKEVAPSLVEARLAEIIRLDPHQGLGWAQSAPTAPAASSPPTIEPTATASLLSIPDPAGSGRTIKECLNGFMADAARSEKFTDKTASQYRQTIKLLTEFCGNVTVRKVDRAQAARFKELVLRLPQKYGQSSRYTGKSLSEIIRIADRVDDRARIQAPTWNRHQVALSQIWDYAKRHGDVVDNVFDGLALPKRKGRRGNARSERDRWGRERLAQLFGSPVFTGMRSKQFPHQPGQIVDFDSKFWLPVIAIATGMRREEIAQLRRRDIEQVNGVDCIRVRAGEGQAIKSPAAERNIPIADALKKLGFMVFIEDQKLGPDDLLLPGCSPMGSMARYGEVTGKWFGRYLRHIGIKDAKLNFHSLRHDFASEAHAAKIEAYFIDYLMGHATRRIGFDRYSSGIEMELKMAIEKIDLSMLAAVKPYRGGL